MLNTNLRRGPLDGKLPALYGGAVCRGEPEVRHLGLAVICQQHVPCRQVPEVRHIMMIIITRLGVDKVKPKKRGSFWVVGPCPYDFRVSPFRLIGSLNLLGL